MTTNFSDRLREFRSAKRLTQGELAEMLGVSRLHVTALEAGRRNPSRQIDMALARLERGESQATESELEATILREDPSGYRAPPRRPPELILHPPAALIDRLNDLAKRSGMGLDAYCCEALDREIATPGVIYRLERADS